MVKELSSFAFMSRILEIKRHLNKPDEHYLCDLLLLGKDDMVLKYVSDKPARLGDAVFEPGSVTYAYYRTGSGFALWKMYGSNGQLRGYLFHICRDLRVSQDRVEYLDLLLDIWISPEGSLTVLDRDELEACAAKGTVDEEDLAWIAHHEEEIRESWKEIISSLNEF
jgi:protein associated with RNAse G/E